MTLKSLSGLVLYVKDAAKTADFYEKLGFKPRSRSENHTSVNLNWFWIDFVQIDKENKPDFIDEANAPQKGSGVFVYLSVDDVDEFYELVKSKGIKPTTEPKDWPWGNREFVIKDPDGYKLVAFKRK